MSGSWPSQEKKVTTTAVATVTASEEIACQHKAPRHSARAAAQQPPLAVYRGHYPHQP